MKKIQCQFALHLIRIKVLEEYAKKKGMINYNQAIEEIIKSLQ